MKQRTIEKKNANKNGLKRAIFVAISILFQVLIAVLLFTTLSTYALWINAVLNIVALIMVLFLYSNDKNSSMKMPWIILILVYPPLGICLYLLIGFNDTTKKMRNQFKVVDSKLFKHLPENKRILNDLYENHINAGGIANFIYRNSGYPVYENTDVTYFDEAIKGLHSQIEDLKKAESFIFMEYFAIEDKEAWQMIEDVLIERAQHGVEVRISYDDMGSIKFIDTSFVKKMRSLGIQCHTFNPLTPGVNVFLNNRDHRKMTIIDGKIGYTGGYNLANEYFNFTHPYGLWKDTGIRLEGDAVKSLTVTFLEMWNVVNKTENFEVDKYLIHYNYKAKQTGCCVQPYADGPLKKERLAEDVYINIVNKANRYCYFITPYLIISDETCHAISLAAKRGVDVRIITPGIPDKKTVYGITRSFYYALAKDGVRIYEWTPGFTHAKMCIVDDRMATCGTINLDYRSLYQNFENGCFVYGRDCHIIKEIKKDFLKTFEECREVTDEYAQKPTATIGIKNLFLRLFAGLL